MILFSHPTGNANVRHAALALSRAHLLDEFWTCLHYSQRSVLRSLLPDALVRQLKRRSNPAELEPYLRTSPVREMLRLLAPRTGLGRLARHETGPLSVDAVYRALDTTVSRRVSRNGFHAVYAYEDGAAETFRTAIRLGKLAFYDLPIGYWRAARSILGEEAERQPEWASTLTGNRDSEEKTQRKDDELALASVVFVASNFTRRTLESAPEFHAPVAVVPYGAPTLKVPPAPQAAEANDRTLRVLFVGSLGQRKGLSYLFDACRRLGSAVRLTVIGARPQETCPALDRELATVRWVSSAPHERILAEMAAHDVFVFPSLFEGFGLVLLEAMAMGLPIITTAHTAGPDLIDEGVQGFIVPIRDAAAIADKLDLLQRRPALRAEMGRAARVRAGKFTWEAYETRLAACVRTALSDPLLIDA